MRLKILALSMVMLAGCNSAVEMADEVVEDSEVNEENMLLEYYQMIDDERFGGIPLEDRLPGGVMDIMDEENYYLEVHPLSLDGEIAMTVFLDGERKLIASTFNGCGPICEQEVSFFWLEDGELVDVTEEILGEYDFTDLAEKYEEFAPLLVLPRHGTTIEVIEQYSGDLIAELNWVKGEFVEEIHDGKISKIDQELELNGKKWIGISIEEEESESWYGGKIAYELWIEKDRQSHLVESFSMGPFNSIEWDLDEEGGVTVDYYSGGPEGGTHIYLIYNENGEEVVRFAEDVRQKDKIIVAYGGDYFYISAWVEDEECSVLQTPEEDYEVTLKGVEIEKGMAIDESIYPMWVNEFTEHSQISLDEEALIDCGYDSEGMLGPFMDVTEFNREKIDVRFSNGQEFRVLLSELYGGAKFPGMKFLN